jgi:16S rRNA (guanine527-N7)-methyltransferase
MEPKLLKTLQKLITPDGIIAAYKGRREKIEAEMASLRNANRIWEAIPCSVPFLEEERNLLVIYGSYLKTSALK